MGTQRRRLAWILLVALAALLPRSLPAREPAYERLFVIGDSLSDGGTYSHAARLALTRSGVKIPAALKRFRYTTNAADGSSRIYAEVLAEQLGIALQPNRINAVRDASGRVLAPAQLLGGTNYAQGGALVTEPCVPQRLRCNPAGGLTNLSLQGQTELLLADRPRLNRQDLVLVWGGSNDVVIQAMALAAALTAQPTDGHAALVQEATRAMAQVAQDLASLVNRLAAAGAGTVVVITIPDPASTPFARRLQTAGAAPAGSAGGSDSPASPVVPLLSALTSTFNQALQTRLTDQAGGHNRVVVFDVQPWLDGLLADPAHHGLHATTGSACDPRTLQGHNLEGLALVCIQDLHTLSPAHGAGHSRGEGPEPVFADHLHPTPAAHRLLAEALLNRLRNVKDRP